MVSWWRKPPVGRVCILAFDDDGMCCRSARRTSCKRAGICKRRSASLGGAATPRPRAGTQRWPSGS